MISFVKGEIFLLLLDGKWIVYYDQGVSFCLFLSFFVCLFSFLFGTDWLRFLSSYGLFIQNWDFNVKVAALVLVVHVSD